MEIEYEENRTINQIAKHYALKCHSDTNHFYDGNKPYSIHLIWVVKVAERFLYLIPKHDDRELILAGCWLHDSIEDTRNTYNDLLKATSKEVAELAYAVTNEKGKNRAERANNKYYNGIMEVPFASFIKLCDRIANVEYSKYRSEGKSMLKKHEQENEAFVGKLFEGSIDNPVTKAYPEMVAHLKSLFVEILEIK